MRRQKMRQVAHAAFFVAAEQKPDGKRQTDVFLFEKVHGGQRGNGRPLVVTDAAADVKAVFNRQCKARITPAFNSRDDVQMRDDADFIRRILAGHQNAAAVVVVVFGFKAEFVCDFQHPVERFGAGVAENMRRRRIL